MGRGGACGGALSGAEKVGRVTRGPRGGGARWLPQVSDEVFYSRGGSKPGLFAQWIAEASSAAYVQNQNAPEAY